MKRLLLFVFAIMPLLAFATDEICQPGYSPAEYVELEYIESTGTQYIDTGIKQVTNCEIGLVAQQTSLYTTGFPTLLGANSSSSDFKVVFGAAPTTTNTFYSQTGGNSGFVSIKTLDTSKHTFLYRAIGNNVSLSVDDDMISGSYSITADTTKTLYLCARNNYGSIASFTNQKVYSCWQKINNQYTVNLIPVRRLSDDAIGMYDKVNKVFHGNQGTGNFIAGPEIGQSFLTDENGNVICVSCPANTYKPNAGNVACTKCPEHTFSPVGSTQLSDCAKILHVGEYVVYMPLGKRTEHGLCVMVDDKKYCADVYERQ